MCAQKAEEKKKADAESNKVFAEGFAIRQKGIDAAKLSIKEKEKELKEKKEKLVQVTAAIVTAKGVKEALEKAENEALAQFDKEKRTSICMDRGKKSKPFLSVAESGLDQVLDQVDQEGEQEEAQGSDEPRKYDETDPKYPKEKVEGNNRKKNFFHRRRGFTLSLLHPPKVCLAKSLRQQALCSRN